ncbi:hypothetical protein FRC10_011523, partial [Ceratobasidium sp. 414]
MLELSLALDSFSNAAKTLAAFGRQLSRTNESILTSLEKELPMLHLEVLKLYEAITDLKKLRNTSTMLVPINRLPTEVLAYTFDGAVSESNLPQARWSKAQKPAEVAVLLASVSSHWRQVALATPALWSYIDLDPRGQLEYQRLWLERSASHPLHIRFCKASPSYHSLAQERAVADLIQPHLPRCQSLCLSLSERLAQLVLPQACGSCNRTSKNLHSLTLFSDDDYHGIRSYTANVTEHELEQFLRPVRAIHLHNTQIGNWSSAAFHGLTELTLDDIFAPMLPTPQQLVNILRASPELRSLRLSSLAMPPTPSYEVGIVNLEKLEVLSLKNLPTPFTLWLLGRLVPRSEGLALRIDKALDDISEATIGLGLPFPTPDRIKVLYLCDHTQSILDLSRLLDFLPNLEALALRLITIERCKFAFSEGSAQRSRLHTLDLADCPITPKWDFVDLLQQHPVAQLRMKFHHRATENMYKSISFVNPRKDGVTLSLLYSHLASIS